MNALTTYLHQIETTYAVGNATEHTYRPALQAVIQALAPGVVATNEPKRIKCGAPDYILTRGQTPLGYIEAKDVGKPLNEVEKSEQLKRYLESLGNLVLTDYLEFRWYVRGEHRLTARLGTPAGKGKIKAEAGGAEAVEELLGAFLNAQTPTVSSPRELAERMAHLARLTREAIRRAFEDEDQGGALHLQMEGFRKTLLHDLTQEQFADMYAQTIAYGLFAARCNVPSGAGFTREHAAYDLPKTNPFLRKMFAHIAGPDLDERIVWVVDDLADLLSRADMPAILADFGKRTRQEDPIVHFYETFLGAYDPKMRESRGVYYTPEPVVGYLVRSVDRLLKTAFKLRDGLADASKVSVKFRGEKEKREVHKVQILDPAAGTATFGRAIINHIYDTTFAGNKGMWSGYVRDHLLPRLIGFELLMAPYAVAHLKLGLQLRELGYDFESNERLRVYLTNTLDEADEFAGLNLFAQWLADEANAAAQVKQDVPVMVITGNPPYSGHSANTGEWINGLLRGKDTRTGLPTGNYFQVDGQPLGERNPKWLNDDYVKFIRFAQWRIQQTGHGILAFVTNHGYLDNPTFRGMRRSLMDTFDDIYVLDLHGNSKKKERTPDGGKDENVFDIQQGVAIGIFVKRAGANKQSAVVRHAHLWGNRQSKYDALSEADVATTTWTTLAPSAPAYLFIPQDADLRTEYEQGWKITEAFGTGDPKADGGKKYGLGICTHNDLLHVGWTDAEVRERVRILADERVSDTDALERLPIAETPYWNTSRERAKVRASDWESKIWPIYYRPFDWRTIYYEPNLMEIGRGGGSRQVMPHAKMCSRNLLVSRGYEVEAFNHVLVSNAMTVHHAATRKEGNYVFPLYLYGDGTKKAHLFDNDTDDTQAVRRANLAPEFVAAFAARLSMTFVPDGMGDRETTFGPEDVFSYMYAIFHAPTYRSRYSEFLKADFARLPLTGNADLFHALCVLGDELTALHLMEQAAPNLPGFPVAGDNLVEGVRYAEPGADGTPGRVWINKGQYFEGVAPDTWDFLVGGYQVPAKWLKDRKGRALSYDDLRHYQGIVAALAETLRLMTAIDDAIAAHGGWPLP